MPFEITLSTLVWLSVKPLIKIALPCLLGAILQKTGQVGQSGVQTVARIQINGALPCLMFANIVTSISADSAPGIGVCICFATFYMLLSFLAARIALGFVAVPENFRSGFLVAATWSNWGNLPLSVLQALASEPPFGHPLEDVMAVAYASFFVLVANATMFAGPGISLIEKDLLTQLRRPQLEGRSPFSRTEDGYLGERGERSHCSEELMNASSPVSETQALLPTSSSTLGPLARQRCFLHRLVSPISLTLIVATLVALVPSLKELFVLGRSRHGLVAPDGKPILSVIVDSTNYFGASAVPLSLLIVGASFAKMSIPRSSWPSLPIPAILVLAFIKLVLVPVIGIVTLYVVDQGTTVFEGEGGRILKMICLYYSCTVTSTNQIALASLSASKLKTRGNVELICAFTIVQYILYPISGTVIIAIGLKMTS